MQAFLNFIVFIFWNTKEGRIRTFYRVVLHMLIFFPTMILIGSLVRLVFTDPYSRSALVPVIALVVMVATIWLAGNFFDRRPFGDFGMRRDRDWWMDMGFGLFLGAFLMSCIFAIEIGLGWVTIEDTFHNTREDMSFTYAMAPLLLQFLCVGIYEELMSRGYHLKNLAEGFQIGFIKPKGAVILAVVVSSGVFGLGHAFNPNATATSTINITAAGVFLSAGYLLTNRMALPIGLHITWNYFQGPVFGFPVSGGSGFFATFFKVEQGGPDLITGGAFGPEAGLIGLAAILLGTLMIVGWSKFRYNAVDIHPDVWALPEACRTVDPEPAETLPTTQPEAGDLDEDEDSSMS